jgi:hypothetical protein
MAEMAKGLFKIIPATLVLGAVSCSWLSNDKAFKPAKKVAESARIVAVKTVRAGALVSKLNASQTYRGSRKAVTWTGARTREGTTATLELFNLIERPVPPDILERLPDKLLSSLTALDFVKPCRETEKAVIASPDLRWEGEVLYVLEKGEYFEIELNSPVELIVITMAGFSPEKSREKPHGLAFYTVYVTEDDLELGEVSFEAGVSSFLSLYGYESWRLSPPGVLVIKALEGVHRYRLSYRRKDSDDFLLLSCYLPRYEAEKDQIP